MDEGLTWPKMALAVFGQVSPSSRADGWRLRVRQMGEGLTWPKMALVIFGQVSPPGRARPPGALRVRAKSGAIPRVLEA